MVNKNTVILLSQVPLPYFKIGSWTTLYNNYINNNSYNLIDYIVCPYTEKEYTNVSYSCFENKKTFLQKTLIKLNLLNPKFYFLNALDTIINKKDKFIFKVVDNYGLISPLHSFLEKKGIRKNCKILFFYHGFEAIIDKSISKNFFSSIDKIIYLTKLSQQQFEKKYNILPKKSDILHNGIDVKNFYAITKEKKIIERKKININQHIVFVWCSQDRPKKGLDFILNVWELIYKKYKDKVILLIIGSNRVHSNKGVINLGRLPNKKLIKYYQISDCYLFPTQWQEGFGMSLIEALHCGNYAIASKIGGIPEVLSNGKYGKLIEDFKNPKEWICAIEDYINNKNTLSSLPNNKYSSDSWNLKMNTILKDISFR